ncbi:MAG: type II toxin-antitoxin system VapC family toxin [Bdellovibrionota bacterium]
MKIKVIDASVAVKWFLIEKKGREEALEVLEELLNSPKSFAVPELFYYETLSVINKHLSSDSSVRELFRDLLSIGINRFSMCESLYMGVTKYQKLGLSGYDGAYAALAEDLGGEWLTFDKQAHKIVKKLNISRLL